MLALSSAHVLAAGKAPIVAVPYYTPLGYAQGLQQHWLAPRATEFAASSGQLSAALQSLCDAPPADATAVSPSMSAAREQWRQTVAAWERLSAVAVGPVLERRSARQIDTTPTRPELIARAVAAAPADAAAMERVGTPAKGLPAMEWMLWTQPVAPGTAECRYARQVAADIEREARALQAASASTPEIDEEGAAPLLGETMNQWLGGVEALRGKNMEKPLNSPGGSGPRAASFPRLASGQTTASWTQQWQTLRAFAVARSGDTPPQPGAGLVPFETYLRGLGLNPLADRLHGEVLRADARLKGLSAKDKPRIHRAALALAQLKQLVEGEVATALKVSVGFTDADGD